ncbi:Uncharacterized protein FWK35_00009693 [Aphis craccivora]|uniref:Uncharacterized protein n=1 Tax=Aphis craccivora TaxID=307492 RepID=A0A6G0YXC9_APHCR|nr:Uncharacterized protein FWK35_00009693 [Aphis craccivora]
MASDVETGLMAIRNRLTGYRYLAVQGWARLVAYDFELIFRRFSVGTSVSCGCAASRGSCRLPANASSPSIYSITIAGHAASRVNSVIT